MVSMLTRPHSFAKRPNGKHRGEWKKEEVMYVLEHWTRKSGRAYGTLKGFLECAGEGYAEKEKLNMWAAEYGYRLAAKGAPLMQMWHVYRKEDLIKSLTWKLKRGLKVVKLFENHRMIDVPRLIANITLEWAKQFEKDGWKLPEMKCNLHTTASIITSVPGVAIQDIAELMARRVAKCCDFWIVDKGCTTVWDWMEWKGKGTKKEDPEVWAQGMEQENV